MADSEVKVLISGDSTSAQSAMASASQAVKDGVAQMKDSLSGLNDIFKGVSESFLAIGAIFAGGAAFKEIVDATKEWTEESLKLGIQLGISASAATDYITAISLVGGTSDDITAATRGLTRQLKLHEDQLNQLGVKTRDVNGDLLAGNVILQNAVDVVNSYKEGIDRSMAAQEIFGRGVTDTNAVFRENAEVTEAAKQANQELGLVVGEQSKAAFEENRTATAQAVLTLRGLGNAIGNVLMPILTQFAQWFREVGPAAIVVTRAALVPLAASIWGIIEVFNVLIDTAKAVFDTIAAVFTGLMKAVSDALHGDMAKAGDDLKGVATNVQNAWKTAWSNIVSDSTRARDAMENLFKGGDDPIAALPGGKSYKPPTADKGDTRLQEYKNELARLEQAKGDYDQKDYAADLAFWQRKLDLTGTATEADRNLRTQIAKQILDIQKKQHDEEIKIEEDKIKTAESLALGEIAAKQEQLRQDFAMRKITEQQEVAGLIELENEKYAIEKKALDDKLALLQFDLLAQQKVKDQELLLEQKHAADVKKINDKAALDEQKTWNQLFSNMRSGFASTISSFLNGTASLGATIKGLFQDIGNSIIQMIANMAAQWLETSLMQILMSKTSAATIIGTLAAQAAAGAFAATAAIPYVGPELAPAAAALAYADTMAFQAAASAAQGFDIPASMNPMVQTHAQEMILPAKYANMIRSATNNGGGGGQTININAVDSQSLYKALSRQGGSSPVAKAIRRLNKGFVRS